MPKPDSRDPSDLRADAIAHGAQLLLKDNGYSDTEALALLYEVDEAILVRVWMRLPLHCRALLLLAAEAQVNRGLPPGLVEFFGQGGVS